jgi:acyl-CoA thioester hydrolase
MPDADRRYRFCLPIQVRFADTDCQAHVYFSNYLVYCDEALSAYMHAIGHPYARLVEQGVEFFFVDTGYQFRGSAHFEETVDVHCRVGRLGTSSFTAEMGLYKRGELIGSGYITAVMVDPKTRRPVPIPDSFRDAVTAYEGAA